MDKVILYFGYIMFLIICLYILFIIFSYILISLGEGLKRKKNKNDDTTGKLNVKNVSDVKPSKIRILIVNTYEGLYVNFKDFPGV